MKLLLEQWRGYLAEQKQIEVEKQSNGFALNLYIDGSHVGQYTHNRDENDEVRNSAEIFPEYRGKGHGTMMLLAAIKTASDLGIQFEEDSVSLTPAMSRLYDELYDSGFIYGAEGAWAVTPSGEEDLRDWMGEQ
jgi:GNAT superfamily N-acetyltransferase